MKFRYLFLTLIALFPILKAIGDYNYRKTVKEEIINFNVEVLNDNNESVDTIFIKIKLNIPKYYTLKKYTKDLSDCTTCGSQYYKFYKNPTKETKAENDTIIHGFIPQFNKNREIDSVTFIIKTYRNLFESELDIKNSEQELLDLFIRSSKIDSDIDFTILNIWTTKYIVIYEDKMGIHIKSYYIANNIPISVVLNIYIHDIKIKYDFYKLLKSIKIESSHTNSSYE